MRYDESALIEMERGAWPNDLQPTDLRARWQSQMRLENTMVSRTLACLDAWIVEAEKLLAEQIEYSAQDSEANAPTPGEPVQETFDLGDA